MPRDMRKAVVVGIDYYADITPLHGCVTDAYSVKGVLERNSDGTKNFAVLLLSATNLKDAVTRRELKEEVRKLFADDIETALFYFAGHGHIETTGGYLCASDCETGDDGLPLGEILTYANSSKAQNRLIVLDSCYSGMAGGRPLTPQTAEISEGLTILTASTAEQYAVEQNGGGLFTSLFVDALNGAASNLLGDVTPGSVYAHIDQSLGAFEQRPVFKTNVKTFISLRKAQPPISLGELRRLPELFPASDYLFELDPDYEPRSPHPDPSKTPVFGLLQKYNRINLVVPVGVEHMYDAAMEKKSCKLTVVGEHWRKLVAADRI